MSKGRLQFDILFGRNGLEKDRYVVTPIATVLLSLLTPCAASNPHGPPCGRRHPWCTCTSTGHAPEEAMERGTNKEPASCWICRNYSHRVNAKNPSADLLKLLAMQAKPETCLALQETRMEMPNDDSCSFRKRHPRKKNSLYNIPYM